MTELPFTNAQRNALIAEKALIKKQIDTILGMAKDFSNAYVELPCKNEKGQAVVWGCNLRMLRRMETWISAARELSRVLSREDQDKICADWNVSFAQLRFKEKK